MVQKLKDAALQVGFYLGLFVLVLAVFLVLCVFILCALIQEGYSWVWHGQPSKNDWFGAVLE